MKRIGFLVVMAVMLAAVSARAGEIHKAAQKGDLDTVKALVEKDPSLVNQMDRGDLPLIIAANMGHLEVCRFLIEKGADVNAGNGVEQTALHRAADYGHLEVCKLLIANGADVNAQDDLGETPLYDASSFGCSLEVCEFLISKGADVKAATTGGRTPLLFAALNCPREVVELYLQKGADINARDSYGNTPLSGAASYDRYEMVKLLAEKGADPKLMPKEVSTAPLHVAADAGDLDLVKLLVEKGADVNVKDTDGFSPLHFAAKGANDVIKYLVEKGAKVNAKSNDGFTPTDAAEDKETIELLVSLGGKDNPKQRARFHVNECRAEAAHVLHSLQGRQASYFNGNGDKKYATTFKDLGVSSRDNTRYAYFLADDVMQPAVGGPYKLPEGIKAEITADGFIIVAVGNIDDDDTLDVWTINEKKELKNVINDEKK